MYLSLYLLYLILTTQPMDTANQASTLIQQWGSLIGVLVAAIAASGAWRVLGRIEGKVERYSDRLDDHSETLEAHEMMLVKLSLLPECIEELKTEIKDLKLHVDSIYDRIGVMND
jgi:hypothetical protein